MDSVLLTPEDNRLHLHARDDIRAVRVDRIVSENEMTFVHYPALSLTVLDEAGLGLWSEELYAYTRPEAPDEATVGRTFAVWESLTLSITSHQESFDFLMRLYYTINPESTPTDAQL